MRIVLKMVLQTRSKIGNKNEIETGIQDNSRIIIIMRLKMKSDVETAMRMKFELKIEIMNRIGNEMLIKCYFKL